MKFTFTYFTWELIRRSSTRPGRGPRLLPTPSNRLLLPSREGLARGPHSPAGGKVQQAAVQGWRGITYIYSFLINQ